MHFGYKCLLQNFLSRIPRGELINYFFQRYVSKSFPIPNDVFLKRVNYGYEHYKNFIQFNRLVTNSNNYYEFGAGQTLIIPLTIAFLGFDVMCIDTRKLIVKKLINETIDKFKANVAVLPFKMMQGILQNINNENIIEFLKEHYGLNYCAPRDAKSTEMLENSFDFISATATLEHIPSENISTILNECYRVLKFGGIMSLKMDYQDQWSYFDKNISIYNFLKYSSKEWAKYSPSLHYLNRLRHIDYIRLFAMTDFKVVNDVPQLPTTEDIKELKKIKLAEEFKRFTLNDLGIKGSLIALIK
jgi:SAM-dependent methyltransferase